MALEGQYAYASARLMLLQWYLHLSMQSLRHPCVAQADCTGRLFSCDPLTAF